MDRPSFKNAEGVDLFDPGADRRGILCQCPRPGHVRGNGEPACPRFAMNQAIGGLCPSCTFGFHDPCAELVLAAGATAGECQRCRWHSSEHAE